MFDADAYTGVKRLVTSSATLATRVSSNPGGKATSWLAGSTGTCGTGTCGAGSCGTGPCGAGTWGGGTCGTGTCGGGPCGSGTCGTVFCFLDLALFL